MHLLLLGLFLGVFLHDATITTAVLGDDGVYRTAEALPADTWPGWGPWTVLAAVALPKLALVALYAGLCQVARRKLGTPAGPRWMRRTDQLTGQMPLILLALYAGDLTFGALRTARLVFRDTVLIDELLVMLPTLATLALTWLVFYPIDRRMRESALMGRMDKGLPIYQPPTRRQYLLAHLRHQVALLFVPLVIITAWSETVMLMGPDGRGVFTQTQAMLLAPAGALGVFLLAPLIIRHVWDTAPLPPGEVRESMAELCRMHRVKVRELLLWRTYGVLINAAVMGLVGPLRFILLSDALLDQLRRREVEAVMAHEIAHVRKHHMFWMLLVLIVTLALGEQAAHALLVLADQYLADAGPQVVAGIDLRELVRDERAQVALIAALSVLGAMGIFGWVSRRIERQADVFAARHLSQTSETPARDGAGNLLFEQDACKTMVQALQQVAVLNHIPVRRKSWRHGSIRWRQDHLRSLVGKPIDRADVDRVVGRVKLATLGAIALLVILYVWQTQGAVEAELILVQAAAIIPGLPR